MVVMRVDAEVAFGVAGLLRREITVGRFRPGDEMPGERVLAEAYGVGLTVIRDALRALELEGLVTVRPGGPARVRAAAEHQPITLRPGDSAIARMPSPAERHALNLEEGVPVIEIRHGDEVRQVHAASVIALHGG
jgi:DNA-binding FadR family transcriptional regulator